MRVGRLAVWVSPAPETLWRMIGEMGPVHMSEAEVAHDLSGTLERVSAGTEIVVERDHLPIAVIRAPSADSRFRTITEAIAIAEAFEARLGYAPVPDLDFARDVQEGVDSRREPIDLSAWD